MSSPHTPSASDAVPSSNPQGTPVPDPATGGGLLARLVRASIGAWAFALSLTVVLWLLRGVQIAWHWPRGFSAPAADLLAVAWQGARFDLKVSAAAALLLWPLLALLPRRGRAWIAGTVSTLYVTLNLINLHYFGFYKTPIDPVIFGFFEDDTGAILQTIWRDFPVALTLALLAGASWAAIALRRGLAIRGTARLLPLVQRRAARSARIAGTLGVVVALLLLVMATKGTLRAMALGRQNVSVTTSQFLNDMVPNGMMSLKFAWDGRKASQNFSDPLVGLRQLGYATPQEAARALGLEATTDDGLRRLMGAGVAPQVRPGPHKNLLFFLMESWSAEPLLYQDAQKFDVLGRMANVLPQSCHFSNLDSAQPGTHPALEALLFSSPITPLTLGTQGRRLIPWSLPHLMQQAGYHTLFLTSTQGGWRELDRVLKVQGFDEIVDASVLQKAYPEAQMGIWGVWDEYLFRYLRERMKAPQQGTDKPLFVFVLTATNHPPYDLPADYVRVPFDHARWGGETSADTLWPNLDTYRYATDQLGGFVQDMLHGPRAHDTVMAATGDHNVRSFGIYATPDRRYLMHQVPFVFWNEGQDCGTQRQAPADHRDMFPTLLPLVGIDSGFLQTGRNLLADDAHTAPIFHGPALSVDYYGHARSAQGLWNLGDPASFVCSPARAGAAAGGEACAFDPTLDARARAQIGLLDWTVRSSLAAQTPAVH